MATWHSHFSSRGRNRAGLIWTWWVFGKPRGEFLAMDGNGQHANIWYILKDPALKGTNLFNLFPLIFSYFQHHFICKDHGQIHRNFHHVSIDFPFLWGHPGRSGLEDGIHWMILGSTGKAVRHGGFHSWLGDDSLISRKKCCRGWSHMLWDPEKGGCLTSSIECIEGWD